MKLGIKWRPRLSRFNRQKWDRPPMDEDLRASLYDYFSNQIDKLEVLLDRDFSAWRMQISKQHEQVQYR